MNKKNKSRIKDRNVRSRLARFHMAHLSISSPSCWIRIYAAIGEVCRFENKQKQTKVTTAENLGGVISALGNKS